MVQPLGEVLKYSVSKPLSGVPLFHSYMKEVGVKISGKVAFLVLMKRYAFCTSTVVVIYPYLNNICSYCLKGVLVDIID